MYRPRTTVAALASALVLAVSAPAVAHDPAPVPPPHPSASAHDSSIVKRISIDRMMGHISHLSETIGSRPAGSVAEQQTVDYLKAQLESYGYKGVEVQTFPSGRSTGMNVIATKRPNNKNHDNGQIVIVGAHHDSVSRGPGANDDASGTAAVLELARIFASTPTAAEVRFAFFGAEENGLVGSRYYANQMSAEEIERTVAMFQMDMVGARDAGHLTMFTLDGQANTVTDLAASAASRVSLNEIPPYSTLGRSDHVPFHEKGIPAALFIHTPLEPWYHTSEDTIDKVSPEKVFDVASIVGAALFNGVRKDTPALHRSAVRPVPVDYYYEDPHL